MFERWGHLLELSRGFEAGHLGKVEPTVMRASNRNTKKVLLSVHSIIWSSQSSAYRNGSVGKSTGRSCGEPEFCSHCPCRTWVLFPPPVTQVPGDSGNSASKSTFMHMRGTFMHLPTSPWHVYILKNIKIKTFSNEVKCYTFVRTWPVELSVCSWGYDQHHNFSSPVLVNSPSILSSFISLGFLQGFCFHFLPACWFCCTSLLLCPWPLNIVCPMVSPSESVPMGPFLSSSQNSLQNSTV